VSRQREWSEEAMQLVAVAQQLTGTESRLESTGSRVRRQLLKAAVLCPLRTSAAASRQPCPTTTLLQ